MVPRSNKNSRVLSAMARTCGPVATPTWTAAPLPSAMVGGVGRTVDNGAAGPVSHTAEKVHLGLLLGRYSCIVDSVAEP
jgi:hypothetical protein